ncbi:MAG: sugar ABC transporter substrate-binding protein [Spirochaetia bacterium]
MRTMIRVLILSIISLGLSVGVFAGGKQESASQGATTGKKVIGLVQIDLSNPFHIGEVNGAKEAARRFGFELKVASGEGDVNKQIQAFENLVNQKVDAIAVNFIDVKAFGPAMAYAKAANIPVVALHSKIDGMATMLGFDERNTGRLEGEYSVKLLTQKNGSPAGKAANLQGLLGQGLNTERSGGWSDVLAKYPDIKIVAQEPTGWDPKRAVEIMENWLTAYPDLDLVYGNSDSLTVPALNAVDQAGRLWDGNAGKTGDGKIIMVSVDGDDFALQDIKDGKMSATVLLGPEYSGFWKVWVPYRIAMGEKVPAEILIKGTLITKENADAAIKLAKDMKTNLTTFPYEKQLDEIVSQYMGK